MGNLTLTNRNDSSEDPYGNLPSVSSENVEICTVGCLKSNLFLV